jgi:hypothetical protein
MSLKEDSNREPSPEIIIKDLRLSLTPIPLAYVSTSLDLNLILLEGEINKILEDYNAKTGIFTEPYIL